MPDVTGCYYSLDEPTLLQMRSDTLAQLTLARQGNRFESMGFSRKTFTKANLTYDQLAQELLEIKAALRHINPSVFGRSPSRLTTTFNGN